MADIFEGVDLTPQQRQELDTLRRGYQLADKIIKDNQVGLAVKRRLRETDPSLNITIPEDDIAEPLLKPVREQVSTLETKLTELQGQLAEKSTALDTKFAEDEQRRRDQDDLAKLQSSIESTVRKHRFTDQGRTELINHMKATNTSDPDTAAAYLLQNMEKPAPVASNGIASPEARRNGAPDVDLFQLATGHDDESMKLLHSNPQKWMQMETQRVIDEGITA